MVKISEWKTEPKIRNTRFFGFEKIKNRLTGFETGFE